jgi:hypothetical protein
VRLTLGSGGNREIYEPARSWSRSSAFLRIALLLPGLVVSWTALARYPLVSSRVAMGFLIGLFLVATVLLVLCLVRSPGSAGWRLPAYLGACLVLLVFGVVLVLNGALDSSPATPVSATVLGKTVVHGKGGVPQYDLRVSPLQSGESSHHVSVTEAVFQRVVVGQAITVEVHGGFAGFPWYEPISPG